MGRYLVCLAVAAGILGGCCSSKPTFDAPDVEYVPVVIPTPPAERVCRDVPPLQLSDLARDAVEADGSLLIQAMTADLLELVAQIMQERHECEASNEVRKVVLEAERIAREKLEELRTHE